MADRTPEPAPVGEDSRTASITGEGKAINRNLDNEDRVRAVPKSPSVDASVDTRPDPALQKNGKSGFGMVDGASHPGDRPHQGGDAAMDGDAQYGASPLRDARYKDDHDEEAGRKHHQGVQPGRRGN